MTEDQAKGKWCPFARTGVLAGAGAVAVNRHVDANLVRDETRCLASDCMAWRRTPPTTPKVWVVEHNGVTSEFNWDPRTEPVRYADYTVKGERGGEPTGYCGLASATQ